LGEITAIREQKGAIACRPDISQAARNSSPPGIETDDYRNGTRVLCPDDWFDATPGDMLYVPAGRIHGFTNTSGAPASMLMLLAPGADRAAYFGELAAIAASGRELSDLEWAEVFTRHDNVMLPGVRTS